MGTKNPVTYTNWDDGEPNNYDKVEKCINICGTDRVRDSTPFMWNDITCNDELNFICEKKIENHNNGNND